MNNDRELLQQALDALEFIRRWGEPEEAVSKRDSAIAAIRARLAQPDSATHSADSAESFCKPEPVAWGIANTRPTEKNPLMMVMLDEPEPSDLVVPLYTAPPQQEGCAECGKQASEGWALYCVKCSEPVREWQGLTDEEYEALAEKHVTNCYFDTLTYARAVETKLKEKNHG